MKKILSILLISFSLLLLPSCQDSTSFSFYTMTLSDWSGAETKVYDQVEALINQQGFINEGFNVEGSNQTTNDTQAKAKFDLKVSDLQSKAESIGESLKGIDGAPCTVQVAYQLKRGSDVSYRISYQIVTIEIEE